MTAARSRSFSTRLSLNILLVVSMAFIVALAIVAVSSHILISQEAHKSAANILDANIAKVERSLSDVESNVKNVAWMLENYSYDDNFCYDVTRDLVAENQSIVGSTVAFDSAYRVDHKFFSPYAYRDEDTDMILQKRLGEEGVASFEAEWYRVPLETGQPHWSEPYFDEGGGEVMMSTYSYPLKDRQGRVYAVLTADISLTWIDSLMHSIHPYPNTRAVLVSKKGNYLMKGQGVDLTKETVLTTAKMVKDERVMAVAKGMLAGERGNMRYKNNGQISFTVYGPLSNGWSMGITTQYRDVLQRTSQMHMVLILVCLFGLLVMFIICYRTIRHLTQPLTEFAVSALNMAKGNFSAHLPEIKSQDEMLRLHDSFEYMQKSINTYIRELRSTTKANERMESELNIARNIQLGMLSKDFPHSERAHLHAMLNPAKEVGGDLYDFQMKGDSLYFAVGDVSGKGVPAALVMAITRAACRFFASMGLTMDKVAYQLNNSVADGNDANMFATLFVGRINLQTYQMSFCNAGHNPIIVIPPDGAPYFYKAIPNLALGLFADFPYQSETLDLKPGTKLLIYTDGVSEAENSAKELFGDDRLLAVASTAEFRQMNSQEMVDHVYASIRDFAGNNEQNDDVTILAISL